MTRKGLFTACNSEYKKRFGYLIKTYQFYAYIIQGYNDDKCYFPLPDIELNNYPWYIYFSNTL